MQDTVNPDKAVARLLYAILKQKNLKSVRPSPPPSFLLFSLCPDTFPRLIGTKWLATRSCSKKFPTATRRECGILGFARQWKRNKPRRPLLANKDQDLDLDQDWGA